MTDEARLAAIRQRMQDQAIARLNEMTRQRQEVGAPSPQPQADMEWPERWARRFGAEFLSIPDDTALGLPVLGEYVYNQFANEPSYLFSDMLARRHLEDRETMGLADVPGDPEQPALMRAMDLPESTLRQVHNDTSSEDVGESAVGLLAGNILPMPTQGIRGASWIRRRINDLAEMLTPAIVTKPGDWQSYLLQLPANVGVQQGLGDAIEEWGGGLNENESYKTIYDALGIGHTRPGSPIRG